MMFIMDKGVEHYLMAAAGAGSPCPLDAGSRRPRWTMLPGINCREDMRIAPDKQVYFIYFGSRRRFSRLRYISFVYSDSLP